MRILRSVSHFPVSKSTNYGAKMVGATLLENFTTVRTIVTINLMSFVADLLQERKQLQM